MGKGIQTFGRLAQESGSDRSVLSMLMTGFVFSAWERWAVNAELQHNQLPAAWAAGTDTEVVLSGLHVTLRTEQICVSERLSDISDTDSDHLPGLRALLTGKLVFQLSHCT